MTPGPSHLLPGESAEPSPLSLLRMSVMTEETLVAPIDGEKARDRGFSPYQSLIVALLALVQFTIILDFMIMSPPRRHHHAGAEYYRRAIRRGGLGLRLQRRHFRYPGSRLCRSVRSQAPAACSSMSASRWERLLCALAPNYHVLLLGRIVTGLFGGVMGSIVLAIITDLFPLQLRGRVMGFVQTAFAASQVLGIPVGLFLVQPLELACLLRSAGRPVDRGDRRHRAGDAAGRTHILRLQAGSKSRSGI